MASYDFFSHSIKNRNHKNLLDFFIMNFLRIDLLDKMNQITDLDIEGRLILCSLTYKVHVGLYQSLFQAIINYIIFFSKILLWILFYKTLNFKVFLMLTLQQNAIHQTLFSMFQPFLGRWRYYHFVKPVTSKVPVNVSLSSPQNECELGNCLDGEFRLSEQSFLAPFSTIGWVNVTSEHSNMLSLSMDQ